MLWVNMVSAVTLGVALAFEPASVDAGIGNDRIDIVGDDAVVGIGGDGNDSITASWGYREGAVLSIGGDGGNDVIQVQGGEGPATATLDGGIGDDSLTGGNGNDVIDGS